jgi:thiosulfate reductase cytochrome b subunit
MSVSLIHPLWLRLTHWLNAIAVLILIGSGWQIYDASPLFHWLHFSPKIALGGWLAGAIMWHFAAIWILFVTAFAYLLLGIGTGRWRRKLWPLSFRAIWHDFKAALSGKLSHEDISQYNAVQKLAYLFVIADIALIIMSGLVLWKSVQFPWLRTLLVNYDVARYVHFFAMAGLVGFLVVHVTLSLLVPRTIKAMVIGK